MDRWMHEDPKLYKYECTKHDTCKKYFKKAYSLRKHLKRMGDKDYPTNISRFFRPEIPPDQETIKDYELPPTPPPRAIKEGEVSEGVETKRRKKKIVKKKDKREVDILQREHSVIVKVTPSTVSNIVQNTIPSDLKPEISHSQYTTEITNSPSAAKRGRKKKIQNITIVQVSSSQTSASPVISQVSSPITVTTKDSKAMRPALVTGYTPSNLQGTGVVATPTNAIIVHTENVKVEMDNPHAQQNVIAVGPTPAINTAAAVNAATVIPIQHPNQLFHQIHVQQQQSHVQPTQHLVQQHPPVAVTASQPITEHVWVSGHQVFYNTR